MASSITWRHLCRPAGTSHEFVEGIPIGAGFRVPCIIVSPWTAGGWVCNDQFDHTSVLQLLEKFAGVREANISEWRRSKFGNLTSALRFQNAGTKAPVFPDTSGPLRLAKYESTMLPQPVLPGGDQQVPKQEKSKGCT
jgi:phospholipase C